MSWPEAVRDVVFFLVLAVLIGLRAPGQAGQNGAHLRPRKVGHSVSRHRWGPPVRVEVSWSAAGGNLYTCLKCGTTRQSEPGTAVNFFIQVYTAPDGSVKVGKAPPCRVDSVRT